MKTLLIFLLPAFLFANVIIFDNNSASNLTVSNSSSEILDIQDGPPATPKDVSAMFNERGFYSSNSVSYDENEIISDFNGNLNYSIPLFNMKGPGDINLNLSANYNGSMQHSIITGRFPGTTKDNIKSFNYSAPGWIFSLNGMAIQMLNLQDKFFTYPSGISGDTVLTNQQVKLLASGYHITSNLTYTSVDDNEDRISLMRGDGSVLTLQRTGPSGCTSSFNFEGCYVGDYYSDNLGEYARAKVEYQQYDMGTLPQYRDRIVTLMLGDGLVYTYEEQKVQYKDFPFNIGDLMIKPQIFLFKKIEDRFGNFLNVNYNTPEYGRPIVQSISGNWYGSTVAFGLGNTFAQGMTVSNYRGRYVVNFPSSRFITDDNRVTQISQITNPEGNIFQFGYTQYMRKGFRIPQYTGGTFQAQAYLYALTQTNNYNGGQTNYSYYPVSWANLELALTPIESNEAIISPESIYKGQGRDPFFTNMLSQKTVTNDGQLTRTEHFVYNYEHPTRTFYQVTVDPVDPNDNYYSDKSINSNYSATNYKTPTTFNETRHYKNYRLYPSPGFNFENVDFPGHTKILSETYYKDNNLSSTYKTVEYKFIPVYSTSERTKSSFLDTAIIESYNSIQKMTRFSYDYQNISGIDSFNSPLSKKITIDPYNLKTVESFNYYYAPSIHYLNAKFWANNNLTNQYYDTTQFYLYNQSGEIILYNSAGTMLNKTVNYYNSQNNDSGYIGQLFRTTVFNNLNFTDSNYTRYQYFRNDTLGRYLYPVDNSKPSNEGKLKALIDPDGKITNYFYHPIVPVNVQINEATVPKPILKYYKVMETGDLEDTSHAWEDPRMPVITYTYPSANYILPSYSLYNPTGNPTITFGAQKYASVFNFDKAERISKVMLPYDFSESDTSYITEIYIDTTYYLEDTVIFSSGRGYYNLADPNDHFFLGNAPDGNYDDLMKMDIDFVDNPESEAPPPSKYRVPVFSVTPTTLSNFSQIDNVFLDYYPSRFYTNLTNYELKVYTLNSVNASTGAFSLGYGAANIPYVNALFSTLDTQYVDSCQFAEYFYQNFYNTVDVTNAVKTQIANAPLAGMMFNIQNELLGGHIITQMPLSLCVKANNLIGMRYSKWATYYAPRLRIQGTKFIIDTTKVRIYKNASLRYVYDDVNNRTEIYSKLTNQQNIRTDYLFDGFYKVKKTRNYKGKFAYDSTQIKYNYLDLKAETLDGKNNSTKFSYDIYKNVYETKNADSSGTIDSTYYQNTYNYYFGTIPGLVTIHRFKDETGRQYLKIFDAVGNLRREIRYAEQPIPNSPTIDELFTDYEYDAKYRLINVRTPAHKIITYTYDGYDRKYSETTADAGTKKFKYDKTGNMTYSQDENQYIAGRNNYTFYTYDGIDRLTTLGHLLPRKDFEPADFDDLTGEQENVAAESAIEANLLTVNVYDTLSNAIVNLFTGYPSDYYTAPNNTEGNLLATAYRTLLSDNWNFKYYRYDARGRVIRMWNVLEGLGTKITDYIYNASNQLAYVKYQTGETDFKMYRYMLDSAGRMQSVDLWSPYEAPDTNHSVDNPSDWDKIAGYGYNQNSQILKYDVNTNTPILYDYEYNNRNWITEFAVKGDNIFKYDLIYQPNGNVSSQALNGTYKDYLPNNDALTFNYTYDLSNRLLKADYVWSNAFDVETYYDHDGNLTSLSRKSSSGSQNDLFSYSYISGTNRLEKVYGPTAQFTYDYNGNLISDILNVNQSIEYDHRNLITQITRVTGRVDQPVTTVTFYKYDDAGNRIRKTVLQTTDPDPEPIGGDIDNPPTGWTYLRNEFYIRGTDGNSIAEYNSFDIEQYNIFAGGDNVGKVNSDGSINYYLKDHLGSIRVVIDNDNYITSAQDYDPWGYLLDNRNFQSEQSEYKFTGKERDNESNYDYFGARYYDSRIARWGTTDPLFEKYYNWSPYNYVLANPMGLSDPDGNEPTGDPYTATINVIWQGVKQGIQKEAPSLIGIVGLPTGPVSVLIYLLETQPIAPGSAYQGIFWKHTNGDLESPVPTAIIEVEADRIELNEVESRNNTLKDQVLGKWRAAVDHLELLEGKKQKYPGPPRKEDEEKWRKDMQRNYDQAKEKASKLRKNLQNVLSERKITEEEYLKIGNRMLLNGLKP